MVQNKIEDLITKIKQGDEVAADTLFDEMLKAKFYVVYYLNSAKKEMISLKSDDRKIYYALCTNLKEATCFKGDLEIIVMSFSEFLLKLDFELKDIGLVINPFGLSLNFNAGFLTNYRQYLKERIHDSNNQKNRD